MIALCLVPLLVAVVWGLVGSDEQAIERIVDECRMAALDADAEAILEHIEEGATAGGWLGEGPLEQKVRYWVGEVARRVDGIDLDEQELEVEEDAARGVWLVDVTLERREIRRKARVKATIDFRRGPEGWRIRRVVIGSP